MTPSVVSQPAYTKNMHSWLQRRIHTSWLIALICSAIFIGIVLAPSLRLPWLSSLGWLLSGIALCLLALLKQKAGVVVLAIAGGLLIGLWRGSEAAALLVGYEPYIGGVAGVSGVVAEDSDTDKKGNLVLRLKNVEIDGKAMPGTAWVSLSVKKASVQRSDRVVVQGKVDEGFGTFPISMYRVNILQVRRPVPGDIALAVRDWFANAVRRAIPEPQASLGVGYLVGQRRGLPEQLDEALRIAGLTHVVVASGYNLTILVRLARRLFVRVSKYLSMLASAGLILSFIAVTGLSPSMSRAGLVAGLSLAAWYYGRKIHPLVLLPFAMAVTTSINPSYAWGDLGWQLSFAAFAGVMVFAPLLQAYYFGTKKPGIVRQVLGETLSAWLCTLPMLMLAFGYISNVAIISNLLILPLVPLAMALTFVAGVGSLLIPAYASIFGFPAHLLLRYMTETTQFFATIPWAVTETDITPWLAALMYSGLILFAIYMWRKTGFSLRSSNIIE